MGGVTCPDCKGEAWRVIYYGLPSRLCADEECGLHWGWGELATRWLPFTGAFVPYERGRYWSALWRWLQALWSPCPECQP